MVKEFGSVDIAGLKLENPVMVGAGPIKSLEQVLEIAKSAAAAIVFGSITIPERSGNNGKTYHKDPLGIFSLNSKGLPNPGKDKCLALLPEMVQIAHDHGKPLIVSFAGFSPQEFAILSQIVAASGADGQELNLGCPNVRGENGEQELIYSFHADLAGEALQKVEAETGSELWTSIKLSPFSDPNQLIVMASVLAGSSIVNAVTTTNTFPNALDFDDQGHPVTDPAEGFAGMSGAGLKPIGLGQVKRLRQNLPNSIAIIGVGGISTMEDVEKYLWAGASAVQLVTAYINVGPSIFATVLGL